MKLVTTFSILLVLMYLVVMASSYAIMENSFTETYINAQKEIVGGHIQTQSVDCLNRADFVSPEPESIESFLKEIALEDVYKIKVWNTEYTITYARETEKIGKAYPDNSELKRAYEGEISAKYNAPLAEKYGDQEYRPVIEIYTPIYQNGELIGVFEVYLDLTAVEARIDASLIEFMMIQAALLGLLLVVVFVFFHYYVSQPLSRLGDLDAKFPPAENNEIGVLAKAFRSMTREVTKQAREIERKRIAAMNLLEDLNETKKELQVSNKALRFQTQKMAGHIKAFAGINKKVVAKDKKIKALEKKLKNL